MKKLFLIPFLIPFMSLSQNFEWAKKMGWDQSDVGKSVACDNSGNVYSTGIFQLTVDFDPGIGVFNLTSSGSTDCYISKLDPNGNFVWAKSVGGIGLDEATSIATDASGNVYVCGYFMDTIDFDPGSGTFSLASKGAFDLFIIKLDTDGEFVWAKTIGGAAGNDYANGMTVDASGTICITGLFHGTVDFDPGPGISNLTSNGSADIHVCKMDTDGNLIWAKSIGGASVDEARDVTTDVSGNVYVTGYFRQTVDFDPGPGISNVTSNGFQDIFVSKLDANGNFIWAKNMGGGTTGAVSQSIAVDSLENVYTTGFFTGTGDFDPGPGTYNLTSPGTSNNIFISKLDANGNFAWAANFGGTGADQGQSIALDTHGNVYTTGGFRGIVDFDPGPGVFNLNSGMNINFTIQNIFICKLTSSGSFVWAKTLETATSGSVSGLDLTVDSSGNIYTTGTFQSSVDFDPGPGVYTLISNPVGDAFVLKLSQCTDKMLTETISSCNSFTWRDGITYSTSVSGVSYTMTEATAEGCDSIYTLNLTIYPLPSVATSITNISCFGESDGTIDLIPSGGNGTYSFNWEDGITTEDRIELTAGNYPVLVTDTNGCSITIDLAITEPPVPTGSFSHTACNSYTWIDGIEYTASNNTATFTLENAAGCDSIVTLNLTINSVTVSTSISGITITADEAGASYQWINCANNIPVSGATNQSFTPTANGNYAVIVTDGNCSDTSACVSVSSVGIEDHALQNWDVFPNPASEEVSVIFEGTTGTLVIRDAAGKLVWSGEILQNSTISLSKFQRGVYFFELKTANQTGIKRVIKN